MARVKRLGSIRLGSIRLWSIRLWGMASRWISTIFAFRYLAVIRKGKNPTAIRCWPWRDDDTLELGHVRKSTDCEDHNAHLLLKGADFRPKGVSYIPFMQAYVGPDV